MSLIFKFCSFMPPFTGGCNLLQPHKNEYWLFPKIKDWEGFKKEVSEVWIVRVIDSKKLSDAVTKNDTTGGGGGGIEEYGGKYYWNVYNIGLFALWRGLESVSEHIIYDETQDNRRFTIGKFEKEILKDFDKVNTALEPYGLQLFKEKRLERLKLIEFHD